jgi:hypothetical protein
MAARLVRAGHRVTVWNRGADGHRRLAEELGDDLGSGTAPVRADSPADAVRDVDVVITMLADWPALETVLFGPAGGRPGHRGRLHHAPGRLHQHARHRSDHRHGRLRTDRVHRGRRGGGRVGGRAA